MLVARWLMLLAILFGSAAPLEGRQEDEKRSTPRRRSDDGVPLDKLPIPPNATVVVTPDLKRALDALGAGSVVLSAERYRELMNRAAEQGQAADKPGGELLFGALRIEGEVKAVGGREVAELQLE